VNHGGLKHRFQARRYLELEWGYLVIYQVDGGFEFEFDQARPSVEEIVNRKGCRISGRSFDAPGSGHVE